LTLGHPRRCKTACLCFSDASHWLPCDDLNCAIRYTLRRIFKSLPCPLIYFLFDWQGLFALGKAPLYPLFFFIFFYSLAKNCNCLLGKMQ